jgi:hypothetical protein
MLFDEGYAFITSFVFYNTDLMIRKNTFASVYTNRADRAVCFSQNIARWKNPEYDNFNPYRRYSLKS